MKFLKRKKEPGPRDQNESPDSVEEPAVKEKGQVDDMLCTYLSPHSFKSEQFKKLRAKILSPRSGKAPRTIMVTSAIPGEGKSFVAANLAITIAQNIDKHSLLMDCDIRVPTIHRMFGYGEVQGLSEYLSSSVSLSSLLLKTDVNTLTILPGGKPPNNPSELLSSRKMAELLQKVKTRYHDRYIVIDAPPPLFTAEANVISTQVDGIILVIKYGSTPRDIVKELVDLVGKENILGIILNASTYKAHGSYGKRFSKYRRQ